MVTRQGRKKQGIWDQRSTAKKWGGIWDHSTGIWKHKPWDRDQHNCKEIRDSVILGDPGADSVGEGKSKRAEKYWTKEK